MGERNDRPTRIEAPDRDHFFLARHTGKWTQDERLDPTEDRSVGSHTEGQRQNGDQCHDGVPGKHPGAVNDIFPKTCHIAFSEHYTSEAEAALLRVDLLRLSHFFPEAQRPHVCPDFLHVVKTLLLKA